MIDFIKGAFSDNGSPSSSRIISAVCALSSIVWISHVVYHTHALPDAVSTAGVTAFSTSQYVVNKVSGIFDKKKDGE